MISAKESAAGIRAVADRYDAAAKQHLNMAMKLTNAAEVEKGSE